MTTRTQTNRLWATDEYTAIRWDAICAAQFPGGYEHNPHPSGSKAWHAWVREFNRELQRMVDEAVTSGRIAEAQEAADHVAELAVRCERGTWWERLAAWVDRFFNTRSE